MTKADLVRAMASSANISQKQAETALQGITDAILGRLYATGETVSLTGFGSFVVKDRAARKGRNPKTGQSITIPPTKTIVFKPGTRAKLALREGL